MDNKWESLQNRLQKLVLEVEELRKRNAYLTTFNYDIAQKLEAAEKRLAFLEQVSRDRLSVLSQNKKLKSERELLRQKVKETQKLVSSLKELAL